MVLRQELYFFPVSSLVLRSCKLGAGVLGFMLEEGMRAEQVAPLAFLLRVILDLELFREMLYQV